MTTERRTVVRDWAGVRERVEQEHRVENYATYFACSCGVCGPIRRSSEAVDADGRAHFKAALSVAHRST